MGGRYRDNQFGLSMATTSSLTFLRNTASHRTKLELHCQESSHSGDSAGVHEAILVAEEVDRWAAISFISIGI